MRAGFPPGALYKVFIEPYDEAAEWRKLSKEKFTRGM
jgi:hypothetical protein